RARPHEAADRAWPPAWKNPKKRALQFHKHAIFADKLGPDWGTIGEFRLQFVTKRKDPSRSAPQYTDEKTIGLGRPRRHQHALPGQARCLAEHKRALAERLNNLRGGLHGEFRMSCEEGLDLGPVFLLQHGASDVGDASAGFDE